MSKSTPLLNPEDLTVKLATSIERAAVVKYLRRDAETIRLGPGVAEYLELMARCIESGEHRK